MFERKPGRGEKMDSRLRRSVLRTALRASVGAVRLGANRTHSAPRHSVGTASRLSGPLPPEGTDTLVHDQELTRISRIRTITYGNVGSRYVTLDNVRTVAELWQRYRVKWTSKTLGAMPRIGIRPPQVAISTGRCNTLVKSLGWCFEV